MNSSIKLQPLGGGNSPIQRNLPVTLVGDRDPVQVPREMGGVIASESQLTAWATFWVAVGRERQVAEERPLGMPEEDHS
jgi:hypothetical protein